MDIFGVITAVGIVLSNSLRCVIDVEPMTIFTLPLVSKVVVIPALLVSIFALAAGWVLSIIFLGLASLKDRPLKQKYIASSIEVLPLPLGPTNQLMFSFDGSITNLGKHRQ